MSYTVPVKEMLFVMENLADLNKVAALPGLNDSNSDTARAVLEEGAKLSSQVVAPLNMPGDQSPSAWDNGKVTASPGFGDAYRQFIEGGCLPITVRAKTGEVAFDTDEHVRHDASASDFAKLKPVFAKETLR